MRQLNLDKDSLQKISNMYQIPMKELQDCINSVMPEICSDDVTMITHVSNELKLHIAGVENEEFYFPFILGHSYSWHKQAAAATLRHTLVRIKEAVLKVLDMVIKTSAKDLE